jgi:hypothetical protein
MLDHNSFHWRIYNTIKEIYRRPKYILLNLLALLAYYYLFNYLIRAQQYGIFLVTIPIYLVYLLVLTSSVALTIGIYSIRNTRNNGAKEVSTGISAVTTLAGGIVGGCGCTEPLILGLTVVGLSTSDTFALVNFISANQAIIFSAMIVINLFVVVYYLNKLSEPSCEIKKRRQ